MAGVTVFRQLSRLRGVRSHPSEGGHHAECQPDDHSGRGRRGADRGPLRAPRATYTVSFETFKQDVDPAPYFAGLPDDRCQCAHWGVVTAGQLTFRWPDHDETYVAGDAYYAPPGHLPLVTAGTTIVEFSPTADLEATMAVVAAEPGRIGSAA